MITKTIEYCSLQYLNQWLANDMKYCEVLASSDKKKKLDILKEAAGYYKIARNLPSEYDEKRGIPRYEPVLDIIEKLRPEDFKDDTVKKIEEIGKQISEKYGNRTVLSLTTKLLWLKIQQPILIYDSQARIALDTKDGDLTSFYQEWKKQFESKRKEIETTCSELYKVGKYTVNQEIGTEDYINKISSQTWFHERVFDIYLWNKGS